MEHTKKKIPANKLENAMQEWQTIFDSINDAICFLDTDRKILKCNRAMSTLLDKPFEKIIGGVCCGFFHGTAGPIKNCPYFRMEKSLKRESADFAMGDKWYNVQIDPIIDDTGNLAGAVHIVNDITERRKEESNLRRMATVVRDSNDAITITDFEGRITAWNRGAELMYGYSEEEALQKSILRLTPPDREEEQKDFTRRLIAGEKSPRLRPSE